ncbi:hypothetical protein [Cryobacterium sp. TMS1-13-1]|uniref:hypothetical protein n=1 Tax=Cryobacterium sp. TMS1-13-1 TaxID=1259220 RepID=UPI00141AFF12|nr:hypothetical protein [Cryobacterium sp. TMS1-13-1]
MTTNDQTAVIQAQLRNAKVLITKARQDSTVTHETKDALLSLHTAVRAIALHIGVEVE